MTASVLGAAGAAVLVVLVVPAGRSRGPAARRARARLRAASAGGQSGRRLRPTASAAAVGVTAVLAGGWVTAGLPGASLAALAVVALAWRRVARRRRAHLSAREAQLPEALERLATAVRAGSSLGMALSEVGDALDPPLGPEVADLAARAQRGRALPHVLDEWAATGDDAGTRLAATAMVLSTIVGSAPARALDGVATTLRERLDLAAERRALAVQARTSALVLSVAPVAFMALLVAGDTSAARFVLGTPAGWTCLGVGLGLDALGAWWMTRLSRGGGW